MSAEHTPLSGLKLYKYFPSDRVRFVRDRLVRLTPPSQFNDPFDMMPIGKVTLPEKQATKAETSGSVLALNPQFLNQRIADVLDIFVQKHNYLQASVSQTYGVLCLSERYDSLLMWAHYANNHKGFVVELDASHPWLSQGNQKATNNELDAGGVRKVTYSDDRPTATVVADYESKMRTLPLSQYIDSYFTKGSDWSYEREWRLLKRLDQAINKNDISFYKNGIALFEVPLKAITSIIFGARISEDDRNALLKCREIRGFKHVRFLQAALSKEKFGLEFNPVEVEQGNRSIKTRKMDLRSGTTE